MNIKTTLTILIASALSLSTLSAAPVKLLPGSVVTLKQMQSNYSTRGSAGTISKDCRASTLNWSSGSEQCSSAIPSTRNGNTITATDALAPSTGTAAFTCNEGTFSLQSGSVCNGAPSTVGTSTPPTSPNPCPSIPTSWSSGASTCSATLPGTPSGSSTSATDNTAPTLGSASYTCSMGSWSSPSSSACSTILAGSSNPTNNCSNQPVSWSQSGAQCQGASGSMSSGQTKQIISTTNNGGANIHCNNGSVSLVGEGACEAPVAPPPAGCTSQTVTWGQPANPGALCSANIGPVSSGTVTTLTSNSGDRGSANFTCTNGTQAQSGVATCDTDFLRDVQAISGSSENACVLTNSGGIKCWGRNSSGQLGSGSSSEPFRSAPGDVVGLTSGASSINLSLSSACSLTTSGAAKCWGENSAFRLGDGTNIDRNVPVDVLGLSSGARSISGEPAYACAITASRGLRCWGDGYQPQEVPGLSSGISSFDLAATYGCALTTGGGVTCFSQSRAPFDDPGLTSGITSLTVENNFACALTTSGGVKCWGSNFKGELGDGTFNRRTTAVDVVGLSSGVSSVHTSTGNTCALTTSGGVKCWGNNIFGQLGNGTNTNSSTPVNVVGLTSGVRSIAVATSHACALMNTGGVKCWGDNTHGQLGDGTNFDRNAPVNVFGLSSGVSKVIVFDSGLIASESSEFFNHPSTCALTTVGGIKCWGRNSAGQLGDGTTTNRRTPVDVIKGNGL